MTARVNKFPPMRPDGNPDILYKKMDRNQVGHFHLWLVFLDA